ncbi:MAG: YaiI/YqxD family protein [Caldicoprobacterales bacterium]|jgi:uncharacterized protein YaiI (UPF0178 family)|nr:YaiI/YqxD family protein [Clostridiales bacterium]
MAAKQSDRKILVDADACPVTDIIIITAKRHDIRVILFVDTSHVLHDDYAEVVVIGKGRDAVDFALVNRIQKGDIVVTQDYGLAAMASSKGARTIHPNGFIYTEEALERLLFERHINAKIRRAGGRHSGPGKRSQADNARFEKYFDRLCSAGH